MTFPAGTGELLAEAAQLRDRRQFAAAEQACRRAIEIRPDDAVAHRLLGTILQAAGRNPEAVASLQRSLRLDRGDPATHQHLADVLAEQGRLGEAVLADREAIRLLPGNVGALSHLATLKRFEGPADDDLAALEEVLAGPLEDRDRTFVLFALAKACDDIGDVDRAFGYLREANEIKRGTLDYDVGDDVALFGRIEAVFGRDLLEAPTSTASESDLPILIVGMPRSGTSLVEQILAAHPRVHGGGERRDLDELVAGTQLLTGEPFPESVTRMPAEQLRALGDSYVARLARLAPTAARVTDKEPSNFRLVGLVRLIAPNARVVHCVRDPAATCFSCYQQNFATQPFAFDLEEIGRYYGAYARLMRHWKSALPPGWMLEIRYEELVADTERQARRLTEHCGLEWDDACLRFFDADHAVRTASVAQVRRPAYGTAVSRWRRYERHLGPLLTLLAEAPRLDEGA